ncbi:alpha/beta hydrolase [Actinoplanes sp. NPDC048796]|uniref:alpha/beta hydrolase n=1 Tax=Actinoplanes sp. NPDC048796 TaxID=3155640 RepID=UPI00340EDC50
MRIRRVISVLCIGVLAAAGLSSPAAAAAPGITDWKPCADRPDVQCATLRVPLDWARPYGPKISLAVARNPVDDPSKRVGTLFLNPGGPGGPGTILALYGDLVFSPALAEHFDLVGVDPRGIAGSTPVLCDGDPYPPGLTLFPRGAAEFRRFVEANRVFGQSCADATGPLISHVDTVSVARDHEAARVALGEKEFNWLGLSYGTQIGVQYANLFPHRVRAMVFDSVLDHSMGTEQMLLDEAATVEDSFNRFTRWCTATAACALHGQDVGALFDRIVAAADRNPMPVPGAARPVSGEDIRLLTQEYLVFKEPNFFRPVSGWLQLGQAISATLAGNAEGFAIPAPEGPQSSQATGPACMDNPSEIRTYDEYQRLAQRAKRIAPHLQGASQSWTLLRCTGYPVRATNPPRRLDVRNAPPILMVNATHDASTAYKWAWQLKSQVRGSVVLTRIGDGHTSSMHDACARAAIDRYLIDGVMPAPGSVCR